MRYSDDGLKAAIYQSTRYITDRQQPDKAIDVIDEAGAKVKLRRVRDTQNLRRLEKEIGEVVREMKTAISDKNFERAVYLREKEIELREDLERLKGQTDEEGSLDVTKKDIEEVISSWTGIPVASLRSEEAEKLMQMEEILGQTGCRARSRHQRHQSCHSSLEAGCQQPTTSGRFVHLARVPRGSGRPRSHDG